MKILLAGASGVIGSRVGKLLVEDGHTVYGTTRSRSKADLLRAVGMVPVIMDALDRNAVIQAVQLTSPDVIVNELTALPASLTFRRFRKEFAATNRLRTTGIDNLLAAADFAKVRRFVAQSYTGWPYAQVGGPIKTEEDPLDPAPPKAMAETVHAIEHLESVVLDCPRIEGVVLRYGTFYGPGTSIAKNSQFLEELRRRRIPLIGNAGGVWSFIHVADAARATSIAAVSNTKGLLNITDDEPAPVSIWLPTLANAIGASPPGHIPRWLGYFLVGEPGVLMMTRARGASNAKAKRLLNWEPRWPSWRQGFEQGLDG